MKPLKTGTIIFIIIVLALAVYATALAVDSNKRADELINHIDILTDGMGR